METIKAISKRKSVRSYKQNQIPEEVLNIILNAGCSAAVASGKYETLHLTIVQDKRIIEKISDAISKFLNKENAMSYGAPTMIFVSSIEPHVPGIEFANAGTILQNMAIAATDQGVDSVIMGGAAFAVRSNDELRKELGIPDGFNPVLNIVLGYAAIPDDTKQEHEISMNRV